MPRGVIPVTPEQRDTTASETDESRACPLCEFDSDEETDIYVHLQTAHRKSALATALLDRPSE